MTDSPIHRMGRFELDERRRELRFDREGVPIEPRVFDLLCHFVANRDRAISRVDLLAQVWSNARVTDASLTKAVKKLRAILSRDPELGRAILTVRGHGYRFDGAIEVLHEVEPGRSTSRGRLAERPFVGRSAPLAELAEVASEARRGRRQFVLIAGEPGSGKTALVKEAMRTIASDFLVGEGQCLEGFGEQSPYLPVCEAMLSLADAAAEEATRPAIRTIFQRFAPSWRAQLPALFPDEPDALDSIELHPALLTRQMLEALEWIGRDRATLLIVEDLQWADRSTLALLQSLACRSSPANLLTICTVRTAEIDSNDALCALRSAVSRATGGALLEASPIDLNGLRQYATWLLDREAITRSAPSESLVGWLHAKTAGNPLYFTQLLEHLASHQLLVEASNDSTFSERRLESAGIPSSLSQLIRRWASSLASDDRALLEVASVAGFGFDLRVVQAALDWDVARLEACCDRLCQAGWLQFRGFEVWADGRRGARFHFSHVLFREALYQAIPPNRRARTHHVIAECLESGRPEDPTIATELASHFELAGSFADSTRHRITAATFAASTQSVDEALHHAELGLQSLAAIPSDRRIDAEIDLRLSIAMALAARRGFGDERALESFEQAAILARRAGDSDREVFAIWGIASCRKMRGQIEAARAEGERLLSLTDATNDPRHLRLALDLLCGIAFFQGRFVDCVELKRRADRAIARWDSDARPARPLEDVRVMALAYASMSQNHLGNQATALEWIREAVARADRLGHPYTSVFTDCFAAILYFIVGDEEGRRRHAARAQATSDRFGIALWGEIARFMALCSDPPCDEALPALRAAFVEMARHGGLGGTLFVGLLADRELAAGEVEAARRLCRAGIEIAERTTERHFLPMLHLTAARLAVDDSERDVEFDRADACAIRIGSVACREQIARARRALAIDGRDAG